MKTSKLLKHRFAVRISSIVIFSLLVGGINTVCYAQSSSEADKLQRQIDALEEQLAKLKAGLDQQNPQNEGTSHYCFEKTVYQEVGAMTNEEFLALCQKEIPEWTAKQGDSNYTIVSSCKKTPEGVQANYCITTEPNVVNPIKPDQQKQDIEKELTKIENTKKMYKDLIASLQTELKSNGIEVVDQGLNLAIKQVELTGKEVAMLSKDMQQLKDNMIVEMEKKYKIPRQNIENENAQLVDDLTNMADHLLSYIPGGDKVTNHYLWRILRVTPELGKMIGNTGAMIHIYFQKDEFQKKLQQLEEREKVLKAKLNQKP